MRSILVFTEAGQSLLNLVPIFKTSPLACCIFDVCSVGLFDATVVGNILSLSVNSVDLIQINKSS